jgi:hypothetical protein
VITNKSSGLESKASRQAADITGGSVKVLEPANRDDIATLAYMLWQERGCPVGSDEEDWFRAEEQLKHGTVLVRTEALTS